MSSSKSITETVRERYAQVASSGLSSADAGVRAVAEAFGYTAEELSSIPDGANTGVSCGNPTATARLRLGETVVDLGSGGGLDVFLAARKVGPGGRAIGIDMTAEMIALARKNAENALGDDRSILTNVEFHHASIDRIPLAAATVDCVISNCVINLAPDKPAVFREIARILKPGGRLAISDIALKQTLPPEIAEDIAAYVGCIAGAMPIALYRQLLEDAGFAHIEIIDTQADLNVYSRIEDRNGGCCAPASVSPPSLTIIAGENPSGGCCGPAPARTPEMLTELSSLLQRYSINDYAASVKVFAVLPG